MLIEIDIREVIIDGERHYRGAERETTRPVDPSIVGDLPGTSPTNPSGLGERFPGIWKAIQRWYPEITVEPVLSPQGEPASDEPPCAHGTSAGAVVSRSGSMMSATGTAARSYNRAPHLGTNHLESPVTFRGTSPCAL